MEDVLGRRSDPERFNAFLANWESILPRRVDQAVAAFAAIEGVRGIVLAGSVGRGEPWPLSDIDLLPIYDDDLMQEARNEVERRRVELLAEWAEEGWWTGLDIGRLAFSRYELHRVLSPDGPDVTTVLQDDRWYYSLDKGYRGRAVYDPDGLAAALARWLTAHRFSPPVVQLRLARAWREVDDAGRSLRASVERNDPLEATRALRQAVKWLQTWQMERWGERDTSFGRFGTRFERAAVAKGRQDLTDALNALSDLDDDSVARRMEVAPDWVWERHDRSWRARRLVAEEVTRLQDARDVLRVCSHYELRRVSEPPFPEWLAIPSTVDLIAVRESVLSTVIPTPSSVIPTKEGSRLGHRSTPVGT